MRPAKRFYKDVAVEEGRGGFRVTLDGRPVKTPAGEAMTLTSRDLAAAVAGEWSAQDGEIRPHTMPLFQLCATALDHVRQDRQAVISGVVAYGPTDLLCYRAVEPPDLVERQETAWQPLLEWAERSFSVELRVTDGIMPVDPAPDLQERLARHIGGLDDFSLAGLATATTTCGSLIVALALLSGRIDPDQAFEAAMLDELYQAEKWGEDEEASERRRNLRRQIEAVATFIDLAETRVMRGSAVFDG